MAYTPIARAVWSNERPFRQLRQMAGYLMSRTIPVV